MIEAETVWLSFERLAAIRNVSLSHLTKAAGFNQNSLTRGKWKSTVGQWRSPRISTLIKVCHTAGVTLTEWAQLVEQMEKEKDIK